MIKAPPEGKHTNMKGGNFTIIKRHIGVDALAFLDDTNCGDKYVEEIEHSFKIETSKASEKSLYHGDLENQFGSSLPQLMAHGTFRQKRKTQMASSNGLLLMLKNVRQRNRTWEVNELKCPLVKTPGKL